MKKLFDELRSKIQSKKRRKNSPTPKICLHETGKDNYRSKRKQLKITFWFWKYFDFLWKYKNIIYLGLFPVFILLLIFILFGPIFTVQNIQILRNDNITEMSLSYSSVENIREKRIVNLDEQVIENKMKEYQNNIKDVDISFNLPDTVKIKLTSYPIYFNTTLNNKSYYVTQNWTLVPWKPRDEYKELIIKKELSKGQIPDYSKLYSTEHIEAIYQGYNYLEENIVDIKVVSIDYYPIQRETHFRLDNDVLLIYTLWRSLKDQIEKSVIYNTEHKLLSDNSIVYIDFRIMERVGENKKEKIFYCTKEIEYQCKQNLKKIY
jgi:hypothetical protein